MEAPEPGKPLLFYITATSEAMSMVLVTERLGPHDLHELGSSSADGSGSQDPRPAEEPGAIDGLGSQDPGPAEEPGADAAAGWPLSEILIATPRGPVVDVFNIGGGRCRTYRQQPVTPCVSKPHDYANHMFMRL
jgi:hypothetical protein